MRRSLKEGARQKLQNLLRRSRQPARLKERVRIILMADQDLPVAEISRKIGLTVKTVRRWLRSYKDGGWKALRPHPRLGVPRTISPMQRDAIIETVMTPPDTLGLELCVWSLRTLRRYLMAAGIVNSISVSHLRRILRAAGLSYQRTKTFLRSTDPDFAAKKRRVDELKHHPPPGSVVLWYDEHGPMQWIPLSGVGWAYRKHPKRLPAHYRRAGTRQLLAALDHRTAHLHGLIFARKTHRQFLCFLRWLRARYPKHLKLYLIMDNLSMHKHAKVQQWLAAHHGRVEFVFLPTYSSWLNRIEAYFGKLRYFALRGTYPQTPQQLERQVYGFISYHNRYYSTAQQAA